MTFEDRERPACAFGYAPIDPGRTLAVLAEARAMRARICRRLAARLFWTPGRLIAGLAPHFRQTAARRRAGSV